VLLVLPLLVALGLALGQGGSLRHLALLPMRGTGFLIASFAIQLLIYAPGVRDSAVVLHVGGAIYIGALVLVLIGALRNWHLGAAVRVATLGLVLNTTVIVLNGGHMPVDAAAMAAVQGQPKVQEIAGQQQYDNTGIATPSSRLAILSDVIPVRLPDGYGNVYSVGDVLLMVGIAGAVYSATRRPFSSPAPQICLVQDQAALFAALPAANLSRDRSRPRLCHADRDRRPGAANQAGRESTSAGSSGLF
jgi:hypothetical protein